MTPLLSLLLPGLLACAEDPSDMSDYWYFRTDHVDIPVRVEGNLESGVILLMLHGGPGGTGVDYNYGYDTELIEDAFAVAYFDQRSQGGTHGRYGMELLTIQQVATDTANLVDALRDRYGQDKQVWLYGHSWGGMLGTATLLDTDADVDGWIEAAGSHDYPLNDVYTAEMYVRVSTEKLAEDISDDDRIFWQEVNDFSTGLDLENISASESLRLNQYGFEAEGYMDLNEGQMGTEGLLEYLFLNPTVRSTSWFSGLFGGSALNDDASDTSYTDRLDEITVPSLFIYGDSDFVCPKELGRDAYERVSTDKTDYIVLEASGHSLMVNQPIEFANSLIDFVDEHGQPR
ncbi:MAG: alpha/beta hydrolase [Myxococcota bacterium]|nr:alpha/beta hydrolase [Myxococcota bacterium]